MTLAIKTNLTATRIKSRPELDRLAPEWNTLLQGSAANSIFLTWEWISSWLHIISPSTPLAVVTVRDTSGTLVAVAPFYYSSLHFLGVINYRCLRVLGDCHSGAEYPDIIVLPEFEDEALVVIAEALASSKEKWECAWIPNIAGWTGAAERLQVAVGASNVFFRKRSSSFSSLNLPASWHEFSGNLSRNRRSALNRQEKKLSQAGSVNIKFCEKHVDLPRFLEALFDLHRKRWQQMGQEGSFVRRPKMVEFYKDFAPKALAKGWLAFFSLTLNEVPQATQYGYLYNNTFQQLQEGYEPAGVAGSGNVLRARIFRWSIEKGVREYDFLGEHTAHKATWCATERKGWRFFIIRKCSLKTIPLHLFSFWPTGRFLRQN